jgi:hypothetical protein
MLSSKIVKMFTSNDKLIAIFLILLIFCTKLPILNVPYNWDEMTLPLISHYISQHNFYPIPPRGLLHTSIFYEFFALLYYFLGPSIWLTHLVIIFFSFLAVFFTYLLAKQLYNKFSALLISLLLFSSPLFFAQSGIACLNMPLTALTIMTLYFLLRRNIKFYLISGCLLVLCQEVGRLLIPLILLYMLKDKFDFKKTLLYALPLFILMFWLFFIFLKTGSFLSLSEKDMLAHHFDLRFSTIYLRFINNIKSIFIYDYKWIISLSSLFTFLLTLKNYKINKISMKKENTNFWLFLLLIIISYLMLFSLMSTLPRYLLLVYPLFFIFICKPLIKNKIFFTLIALISIFSFINQYTGNRTLTPGGSLDSNLEYLDFVKVHQEATKYIELEFSDATVLTTWPGVWELSYPALGYVNKSIKVKSFVPDTFINMSNSTFELLPTEIGFSNVDVIYVSDINENELAKARKYLNLSIIKRFECNGKFTEIYKVI